MAVVFSAVSICSWFSPAGVLRCSSGSSRFGLGSRVHVASTSTVCFLLKCVTVEKVVFPLRRVWSMSMVIGNILGSDVVGLFALSGSLGVLILVGVLDQALGRPSNG